MCLAPVQQELTIQAAKFSLLGCRRKVNGACSVLLRPRQDASILIDSSTPPPCRRSYFCNGKIQSVICTIACKSHTEYNKHRTSALLDGKVYMNRNNLHWNDRIKKMWKSIINNNQRSTHSAADERLTVPFQCVGNSTSTNSTSTFCNNIFQEQILIPFASPVYAV